MEIRLATINDAEQILAIQRLAYQSEAKLHNDFDIPPLTQSLDELKAEFSRKTIIKINLDGFLIASGQAFYDSGTCFIGRMAVLPKYQGQGLGSKLLSSLESVFPDAKRAELFTGELSQANLAMYKHRGYELFKNAKLGKTKIIFLEKKLK